MGGGGGGGGERDSLPHWAMGCWVDSISEEAEVNHAGMCACVCVCVGGGGGGGA